MFCTVHVDYKVVGNVNNNQRILCLVHVGYDVLSEVVLDQRRHFRYSTWTMTSSPRSFLTRCFILRSLRGLLHPLQGQSWPDGDLGIRRVLRCRLRRQSWQDDVLHSPRGLRRPLEVILDRTIFYVFHVEYVLAEVNQAWRAGGLGSPRVLFTTSSSGSIVTRRCSS